MPPMLYLMQKTMPNSPSGNQLPGNVKDRVSMS